MRKLFQGVCLGIIVSSTATSTMARTYFSLEAGTYQRKETAEAKAETLRSQGFSSVTVDHTPDAPGNYEYRTLVGNFKSKAEAKLKKDQLEHVGFQTFIRGKYLYKHDRIETAINGKMPKYFHLRKGEPVPKSMTTAPLTGEFQRMKAEASDGPATAPETLAAYKAMVESMPDNNPLKGREVLSLARHLFSGHSAYDRNRPDYVEIKRLLMKVATKQTSATSQQRRRARDLVVHITHYYEHDYVTAIRAYKQIIDGNKNKRPTDTAIKRASLAGAIFEVSKVGNFSTTKTQDALYELWLENVAVQKTALTSETRSAKVIRYATARIGLMLSESYIQQKMWTEAEGVAKNLIDSYTDYKDCSGAVAEAYCHLAHIGAELNDKDLCNSSADAAIQISKKIGRVWGDKGRDTLWKAYAWKNVAAYKFNESKSVRANIKHQMINLFPNHPGLKTYFGEDVEQ